MTVKAKRVGRKSLATKREELVASLWGDELGEIHLWHRRMHDGFSTVPRTMPHIARIIDGLSDAGSPLSQTYLALWCRVFDESFIEIKDKDLVAYESGFGGQRAVTTWSSRMRRLRELGFISTKAGASGEFQYVILINPYHAIRELYAERVKDERYNALVGRMAEVGATWE